METVVVVKTDDLKGAPLDYALKLALGLRPVVRQRYVYGQGRSVVGVETFVYGEPSKDDELMGRQFFYRNFNLNGSDHVPWLCSVVDTDGKRHHAQDKDKFVSIGKLIVKMELGYQVQVPKELVEDKG